jgi:hypothetical protein
VNPRQFRDYIVRPVVESLGLPTPERRIRLLLMTAAHESGGLNYVHQVRGPAKGIFQMEPATHDGLYSWVCNHVASERRNALLEHAIGRVGSAEQMVGNFYYAAAIAAFNYYSKPGALPGYANEMAEYAKRYWNTSAGKATPSDYENAYIRTFGYLNEPWPVGRD